MVFYENLKYDLEMDLVRVLRFLQVPVDEKKLRCLRKYPVDVHKRKGRERQHRFFCQVKNEAGNN